MQEAAEPAATRAVQAVPVAAAAVTPAVQEEAMAQAEVTAQAQDTTRTAVPDREARQRNSVRATCTQAAAVPAHGSPGTTVQAVPEAVEEAAVRTKAAHRTQRKPDEAEPRTPEAVEAAVPEAGKAEAAAAAESL